MALSTVSIKKVLARRLADETKLKVRSCKRNKCNDNKYFSGDGTQFHSRNPQQSTTNPLLDNGRFATLKSYSMSFGKQ